MLIGEYRTFRSLLDLDTAAYWIAPILSGALSIGAAATTLWLLGATVAGDLALTITVANVSRSFLGIGMHGPLLTFAQRRPADRAPLIHCATVAVLISVATTVFVLLQFRLPATICWGLVAGGGAALLLVIQVEGRLSNRPALFSVGAAGQALALLAALLWAEISDRREMFVPSFALLTLFVGLLGAARTTSNTASTEVVTEQLSGKWLLGVVQLGLATMVYSSMAAIISFGDRFFVDQFLDRSEVGRYATLYSIVLAGIPIISAVSNVWMKDILIASNDALPMVIRRVRRTTLRLSLALSLGGLLSGQIWISISDLPGSHRILAVILASAVPPYALYLIASNVCIAQSRLRQLAGATAVVAAFSMISSVILIQPFGLSGAAVNAAVLFFFWAAGGVSAMEGREHRRAVWRN
jgi:hypothetical protein